MTIEEQARQDAEDIAQRLEREDRYQRRLAELWEAITLDMANEALKIAEGK